MPPRICGSTLVAALIGVGKMTVISSTEEIRAVRCPCLPFEGAVTQSFSALSKGPGHSVNRSIQSGHPCRIEQLMGRGFNM
jgi:hypothetical protein